MKTISRNTSIEDIAALVCQTLTDAGIEAILTGGSVVSIYSHNEYVSRDLDFISHASTKAIKEAMEKIGFTRSPGRHFTHPETEVIVEFPAPPLAIGDEPIHSWEKRKTKYGTLQLLSPTDCVMDRLAAYYHWQDSQSLDQAIAVAKRQPVNLRRVRGWSRREGMSDKFQIFESALKKRKR